MKVSLTGEANRELREETAFYVRSSNAALGRAFAAEFERSVALLALHPLLGSKWRGPVRHLALRRFPYTIVYEVRDTELRIIAIAHQRRRPGYWTKRS